MMILNRSLEGAWRNFSLEEAQCLRLLIVVRKLGMASSILHITGYTILGFELLVHDIEVGNKSLPF